MILWRRRITLCVTRDTRVVACARARVQSSFDEPWMRARAAGNLAAWYARARETLKVTTTRARAQVTKASPDVTIRLDL